MGTIVLMGGNEFRPNCIPMDRGLLSRVSHQSLEESTRPRVVILPTAAAPENPRLAAGNGVRYFEALGAVANAVMVIDRHDADDGLQATKLKDADIVYLTGGNPSYLLDCLRDSAVWTAIKELYEQRGMVIGSSAGAMVLGESMWTGAGGWIQSLGLAPRVAVLPHYERASNVNIKLLRDALEPHIVILGIETATACVNYGGNTWQVVGVGNVTVHTGEKAYRYGSGQSFNLG